MRFEHVNTYPASAAEVQSMLCDAAFRNRVGLGLKARSFVAESTQRGDATEVVVRQSQPTKDVPSMARKFVGDSVEIIQREHWHGPGVADLSIEMPGKPGSMEGTIVLRETPGGCEQVLSGDLRIKVPLVGGRLEGMISELLKKALVHEQRTGVAWLAERAG